MGSFSCPHVSFVGFFFLLSNSPVSIFIGLKDDLLDAQVDTRTSKAQLEGEVALTG